MKQLLILLLLCLTTPVQAQDRLKTQIANDNQKLSIQIDGTKHGRQIHYKRTFDVSNLNGLQIDLLKYRVFASQGVTLPIHEMKGLLSAALGGVMLLALIIAFLIVRSQSAKGGPSTSGKNWQVA